MEANDFLAKLKENVNEKDWCNLSKVYNDYKAIASKLSTKERGSFSLNVLCLLCRNLDKAPTWRDSIDTKDLLTLTIDCIRETRGLNKSEQVKTLACIYHIHRYVVRKNAPVPPELILKLSFMPFEAEPKNLLKEYSKTYWNIVADRLIYIEKLKGKAIHKLLPKLTEDLLKTLDVYDTAQFCENILVFLVKKLHFIYSENYPKQLNVLYGEIFEKLSRKTDFGMFKKLKEKTTLDLYVKFSDCLYVIAENSSKNRFKESALTVAVRAVTTILGHRPDIFHCLQTFYLNSFCDIFVNKTTYLDAVFKNLTVSCEITEKLGYKDTMVATYPFIGQFLRLFIEYSVNNGIKINFTQEIQENCLNFMIKLLNELKNCEQLLKCENCKVKSGLHDALRLSFLLKHFITNAVQSNCDLNNLLPLYKTVIESQYSIMGELKKLACVNYEKCYRKLQTDTHNTAILLNKNEKYEFSINLFEVYIKNELSVTKKEFEHKNVARAFYNKSICELDYKKHENALFDAFLSLLFSKDLNSDKYMSLVMDIKAKALKCDDKNDDEDDDDDKNDDLQLLSVLEACKIVMEQKIYGDLTPFLKDVKFSLLLKHEFDIYCKLWPSIVPVAGVWRSLNSLLNGKQEKWMTVEDPESLLWLLLEVISVTPEAVRTIHSEYFKAIVNELLEKIDNMPEPISSDFRVAQTVLLFLKAEYDIAEASTKYGWKVTETSIDPDLTQAMRSISQEHEALQKALQAVEIWTELAVVLDTVTNKRLLRPALQLAQIFVQQLLHFSRTAHALQLAHVCCQIAIYVDDKESYLLNAGILISHMDKSCPPLRAILSQATEYWPAVIQAAHSLETALVFVCDTALAVIRAAHSLETALVFVCDAAIYYNKIGQTGVAAKLVQLAQTRILTSYDKYPDINLDLAVGRLMEAQTLLCRESGLSTMSAVNSTQRHYLSISNTASKWYPRRLRGLTLKQRIYSSSARGVRTARVLRLWRRARSAAAVALPACAAPQQATMYADIVNVYRMDDAQVKIDNRLKYILGIPSNEQPSTAVEPKIERFAPKQDFEMMLECQTFKSQISPTRKYVTIPGFKMAEFFRHNSCDCYACINPICPIIAYITGGLEASMYFRANEFEIAGNYFKGVINTFGFFEDKLKHVLKTYSDLDFEKYVIDGVKRMFEEQFRKVKLEILIEASFYELKNGNFDAADDYIVTIHEIVQDLAEKDSYLSNEVMNLLIASAKVRNVIKKQEFDLEAEFENLKLSPKAKTEGEKTPESKAKLPQAKPSARKVKDEELPKKRKVIKLNLDENSSDEKEVEKPKPRKKVSEFKIPVPVTSKPVIENLTPRPTRKPVITITDTTKTPKVDKKEELNEFFTPQSTPEQFFTPLNTIKTYSKSTLRKGIVKNLEQEFSTPKTGLEKENVKRTELPTRSGRKEDKERALKRATSPGKLSDSQTRPRRLRQPKIE
ncbi:hypothetical protein PYW07_013069 [Mythimna separata]|uniref:Separase n=1 Tax=Mythimna separata TaxID=271217 RepID=A0AAD7Y607_MYTSE|nr:hypothetical protein PYW07_013069 [Mythimna separata]